MLVIELILSLAIALLGLPVVLLLVQVWLARSDENYSPVFDRLRPSVVVLVPAHDEEVAIAATVRQINRQLKQGDRVLVVADNCSDATAESARAAGAQVIERCDPQRRGKGYALAAGVHALKADPPQVVIVIDADCYVGDGALLMLSHLAAHSGRPVQARYRMIPPAPVSAAARLASFAWQVKTFVRPLGFHRLGLPCHLMGSGMAFPWEVMVEAPLATGHLVEDSRLGLELATRGTPPLYCRMATVSSQFPSNQTGTRAQRRRWEHGQLGMLIDDAPRAVWHALRSCNWMLLALALDLLVPPLALLALIIGSTVVMAAIIAAFGLWLPLMSATFVTGLFVLAIVTAWWRFGRALLKPFDVLHAAMYALRKVRLYLGFLVNRQVGWVRTQRDR